MRVMQITDRRSASGEGISRSRRLISTRWRTACSSMKSGGCGGGPRRISKTPPSSRGDRDGEPGAHGRVERDRSGHPGVSGRDETRTAARDDAAPPGTHRAGSGAHPGLGGQADREPRLPRPGGPSGMPDGEGDSTVTETPTPDERLADAFRALEDTYGSEVSEDLRERSGWPCQAPCRPNGDGSSSSGRPPIRGAPRPGASRTSCGAPRRHCGLPASQQPTRARRWVARWLAAAAASSLSTTIGVVSLRNRRAGDEFRASPASSWSRSCRPTRRFRATRSGSAGRPDPRDRGTRCG